MKTKNKLQELMERHKQLQNDYRFHIEMSDEKYAEIKTVERLMDELVSESSMFHSISSRISDIKDDENFIGETMKILTENFVLKKL